MALSKAEQLGKERLQELVNECTSKRELARKIGYRSIGDNWDTIQRVLDKFDISIEHFTGRRPGQEARSPENIFIENSTADQATLRRWYLKGNYTPYKCAICGQEPFWNGRELTLTLDHINGINNDDRLENLRWVCPNCDRQTNTFAGKNVKKKPQSTKHYCLDCGKEIFRTSMRCPECARKHRRQEHEVPVSRDELKKLIRNTPFTTIAKEFGYSDKAVAKWCKKLGLPSTKKEINSYSDKEWELI